MILNEPQSFLKSLEDRWRKRRHSAAPPLHSAPSLRLRRTPVLTSSAGQVPLGTGTFFCFSLTPWPCLARSGDPHPKATFLACSGSFLPPSVPHCPHSEGRETTRPPGKVGSAEHPRVHRVCPPRVKNADHLYRGACTLGPGPPAPGPSRPHAGLWTLLAYLG